VGTSQVPLGFSGVRAAGAWLWSHGWLFVPPVYGSLIFVRRAMVAMNAEVAIWPTAALLASAILLTRGWARAYVIAGGVAVNILIAVTMGYTPRTIMGAPEACLLAYLTWRSGRRGSPDFASGVQLFRFVATAAAPASAIFAAAVYLTTRTGVPVTLENAANLFIGHLMGAAILVPCALILAKPKRYGPWRRPASEFAVYLVALTIFTLAVLWPQNRSALTLLIFPLTMFTAFRYGPVGAAMASLTLCATVLTQAYWVSPMLKGPWAQSDTLWTQMLVAIVFLITLPAAGSVAANDRMRKVLERRSELARTAQHRADAATRAKSEFLANLSHEIRTPLNGVIGLVDALSRTRLDPEQKDMLGMVRSSGQALTSLLSDALDLARAESGALRLSEEPFEIREAVGSATYLFEAVAREKGLSFAVSFDLDAEAAVGDPLRIRQIVSNLTSNAVKFTDRGGVRIAVRLKGPAPGPGRLEIEVRDTGRGFSEEVRQRLFNRFEQGDGSVTRRFGGAGLGLSISRRLAELMGGTIECSSTPGRGAAFVLSVPLMLLDQPLAQPEPAPAALEPGERRMRVLVAEDHVVNQKVIQAMLGDTVELTMVEDGQAAVEACRQQHFDCILMDTHMPVLGGHEAIAIIRAEEAVSGRPRAKIVSLTADAMPQQVTAALAAGADLHVAKPITAEVLVGALMQEVRPRPDEEARQGVA
jgi:signal transduction histidine kinase/ActR/RegA family two-component response regulator